MRRELQGAPPSTTHHPAHPAALVYCHHLQVLVKGGGHAQRPALQIQLGAAQAGAEGHVGIHLGCSGRGRLTHSRHAVGWGFERAEERGKKGRLGGLGPRRWRPPAAPPAPRAPPPAASRTGCCRETTRRGAGRGRCDGALGNPCAAQCPGLPVNHDAPSSVRLKGVGVVEHEQRRGCERTCLERPALQQSQARVGWLAYSVFGRQGPCRLPLHTPPAHLRVRPARPWDEVQQRGPPLHPAHACGGGSPSHDVRHVVNCGTAGEHAASVPTAYTPAQHGQCAPHAPVTGFWKTT